MFIVIVIIAVIVVIALIASNFPTEYESKSETNSESESDSDATMYRQPKIGSEVTEAFYDEILTYCRNHSMTISDLIRNSVRDYIDHH